MFEWHATTFSVEPPIQIWSVSIKQFWTLQNRRDGEKKGEIKSYVTEYILCTWENNR